MFRRVEFKVPSGFNGKNVKTFLSVHEGISTNLLVKLKSVDGGILLNGKPVFVNAAVSTGDVVLLKIPMDRSTAAPVSLPLSIAYEDDDVLVVHKPPHQAVHQSLNHQRDSLANAVTAYLHSKGLDSAFRCINRLDRDTSGLVAIALNPLAAQRLGKTISKVYFALVSGELPQSGTIDAPIARVGDSIIKRCVRSDGVRAVTHFEAVQYVGGNTLAKINLQTGRTHQIRVHFAHLGMPLVGDSLYGQVHPLISRQALHCESLCFEQPVRGEKIELHSPLPHDFEQLLFN